MSNVSFGGGAPTGSGSAIIANAPEHAASGIAVQEAGETVVADATKLNFTSGATVTDGGSGVADVAITGGGGGIAVQEAGETIVASATKLNFTSNATVTDGGGGVADVAVTGGGGSLPDIVDVAGVSVTIGTPTWTGGTVINADPSGETFGLNIQGTTDDALFLDVTGTGNGQITFAHDDAYGEAVFTLTEGYLNGNLAVGPGFNSENNLSGSVNNFGSGISAFDRTAPIIFTSSGALTITGFVATAFSSSTPIPGVPVIRNVYNAGTGTVTLAHNSSSSTSGNRILCPGATNLVLNQYENAVLQYIPSGSSTSVDGFWIVLSHS